MTYYRQTVLIPVPKQRLCEVRWKDDRRAPVDNSRSRMGQNRDVNSILSFFE